MAFAGIQNADHGRVRFAEARHDFVDAVFAKLRGDVVAGLRFLVAEFGLGVKMTAQRDGVRKLVGNGRFEPFGSGRECILLNFGHGDPRQEKGMDRARDRGALEKKLKAARGLAVFVRRVVG